MFLGWSSTKLLFFVPVGYSIWLPGPIICSEFTWTFGPGELIKPILLLSLYIYLYSGGRGINLGSPYFDHVRV
jgi:hypothetical protein